ncbi:MAG: DUF3667 domain-containing protein [Bacteroidia bacterium]
MNLKHIKRADTCLNCGTALDAAKDNFCPSCGQVNNVRKETAIGLVRELVEEFLHFDSKVMASLVPLLIKPGFLTKDYNAGRRARYFHPVRMFLTLTVIMFVITGMVNHKAEEEEKTEAASGRDSADATTNTADSTLVLDTDDGISYAPVNNSGSHVGFNWSFGKVKVDPDTLQKYIESGVTDEEALMDTFGIEKDVFNKFMFSQIVQKQKMGYKDLASYYKSKLPWLLFSLMPVFAFVLFLLYIRRKIFFVDHLIHAFHLHSAVFLIIAVSGLLYLITGWDTDWLLLYIPVYYYLSLHRVYGQSWSKTFLKGTFAGVLYTLLGILVLSFVALVMFLLL